MLNDRRSSFARPQDQEGPSTTRLVARPAECPIRLLAELSVPCRTKSDVTFAHLADQARRGSEHLRLIALAQHAQQRRARASRHRHQSIHDLGGTKGRLSYAACNQAVSSARAHASGASAARDWRTGAGTVLASWRGVLLRARGRARLSRGGSGVSSPPGRLDPRGVLNTPRLLHERPATRAIVVGADP